PSKLPLEVEADGVETALRARPVTVAEAPEASEAARRALLRCEGGARPYRVVHPNRTGQGRRRTGSYLQAFDGIQAAYAERQARDVWSRRSRGRGRCMPLHRSGTGRREGVAWRRGRSIRHFTCLSADRPDPLQGEVRAGRGRVSEAPFTILQEDANRPWL